MNKQKLLQLKIELCVRSANLNGALKMNEKISSAELEARTQMLIDSLYESIVSLEPTHESQVV